MKRVTDLPSVNFGQQPYLLTIFVFCISTVPAVLATGIVVKTFALESGAASAVTEPILTKAASAFAILWYVKEHEDVSHPFHSQPVRFAFVGGIAFGLFERLGYLLGGYDPIWPWIISIVSHGVFSICAAGPVFDRGEQGYSLKDYIVIVVGILAAVSLHFTWNVVIL